MSSRPEAPVRTGRLTPTAQAAAPTPSAHVANGMQTHRNAERHDHRDRKPRARRKHPTRRTIAQAHGGRHLARLAVRRNISNVIGHQQRHRQQAQRRRAHPQPPRSRLHLRPRRAHARRGDRRTRRPSARTGRCPCTRTGACRPCRTTRPQPPRRPQRSATTCPKSRPARGPRPRPARTTPALPRSTVFGLARPPPVRRAGPLRLSSVPRMPSE